MRNSSKSFAHQYGVTHKNIATNPSIGIGLNPNLNIQDEYIENLLKQTHFLNMEIKLMKQKQKQNKGMGIMGLLNKDQNPVVTHAISSNNKYAEMKNKLASMVNTAQVEYLKLDDQNFAVKAQRDFAQKISLKQQQKNIENKIYVDKQLGQNINQLRDNQKKLSDIRQQNSRINDNHDRVFRDWQEITSKQATKKLFKQINNNLEQQFEVIKQRHFQIKAEILAKNQKFLKDQDQKNRQDPNYISLLQENQQLTEKYRLSEKNLFDKGYKVKQMEELKKLAIRNKDYQAEAKKQAVQQAQKLRKKLADRKAEFETKVKEAKNGLQTNDQVRLLKGKVARKDKEIADLRKKTEISQKNYKSLRDQVARLTLKLGQLKASNENNEKNFIRLTTLKNQTAAELNKDQLDNQKLQSDLNGTTSNLKQARKRLEGLQQQITYLKAKEQYLSKQINLDQGMKGVKIDQLNHLVSNNQGLNSTIKDLMDKWQQIRRFSREPPIA